MLRFNINAYIHGPLQINQNCVVDIIDVIDIDVIDDVNVA